VKLGNGGYEFRWRERFSEKNAIWDSVCRPFAGLSILSTQFRSATWFSSAQERRKVRRDIKIGREAARRWSLGKRMPEEKTQHFPRCVRSPRIRVGAHWATSGPRMAGAVDIPML
jgi:hypothetical protein